MIWILFCYKVFPDNYNKYSFIQPDPLSCFPQGGNDLMALALKMIQYLFFYPIRSGFNILISKPYNFYSGRNKITISGVIIILFSQVNFPVNFNSQIGFMAIEIYNI